ncbi:MAG: signal peptidase I, partial [Clostridiales bacterium]
MAEAKRATEKAVQKVAAEAHQKAADSQYQMSPTTNQPLQTTIKNNIIPGVFNQNFMQNQPTTSKPQTIDNRHANLETINQTDNLPYPDTNLEGLFKLASEAESQAQFAATAARNASTAAHANMMNMTPENPVVANKIQQSTFAAAKNAVEAAKAALKAQSSAMEATAAAISQSMRELDRNKALIQQQETSIIKLNANMDNAQTAISKALEAFRAAKMKAEEEAARIQEYKNQLFQAAQEKQALEQYMLKAQENLNFAHVRARETRANYLNIQTLTEATEKDLYCIVHSIPLQQPYPATPVSINYQNQTNTQPLFPDQNNSSAKNTPAEAPNREQTIDIEVSRPPEVDEPEQKPTLKAMLWSYGKLVIIAFAIAFLLRAFVFEVTQVEGPSMSPTLVTDDKLITSKLAYTFGQPQRGDIVVLDAPDAEGQYYIKRVIGLPNERITIKDGRVYINDLNLTETYLTQLLTDGDVDLLIPEGYYFVMGDNRGDSRDSRMESVGLISKNALDGKAV